jgi:CHRD domain-containing protein
MKTPITTMFAAGVLAGNLVMAPAAFAETIKFKADLKASNEVPPNNSNATGVAEASFDTVTKNFSATVTFAGLSGPCIGAHVHGPGEPGKNAGIVLPFNFVLSPIKLSAALTDTQAADLMAGRWYVNIHTQLHPGGEIRGQLTR